MHDHEIISQSGPVEFKGTPSLYSHLAMPPKSAKNRTDPYSHPMRRLINALLAFFLPALVGLTVRAVEELPSWAIKAFNEKLSARYELVKKIEPSFFAGDFNGDGRSDVALLIQERTTSKVGIAILESGKNQFKILGAGKSFGNGGDDFSWMDVWSTRHSGKADQLYVGKREAASAVIYWDGSKYKWQQEGD